MGLRKGERENEGGRKKLVATKKEVGFLQVAGVSFTSVRSAKS